MSTIHLLGSEGFIGRSVQREAGTVPFHFWSHKESDPNHHFNLLDSSTWYSLLNSRPTHAIFLSWPGLPNYQQTYHVTRNLPACVDLIDKLVNKGLQRLVVAGTCYEYGMHNGSMKEDQLTDPVNSYAIAKDSLRRLIEIRYSKDVLQWCWARIFYPFGHGQNPNSLLPSLKRAIEEGHSLFPMSSGRQIRDFVHVDQVAKVLLELITNSNAAGIYNCGSGKPISLREFAEEYISNSSSAIKLELGSRQDRDDEPFAFWADMDKTNALFNR